MNKILLALRRKQTYATDFDHPLKHYAPKNPRNFESRDTVYEVEQNARQGRVLFETREKNHVEIKIYPLTHGIGQNCPSKV